MENVKLYLLIYKILLENIYCSILNKYTGNNLITIAFVSIPFFIHIMIGVESKSNCEFL